MPCYDPRNDTYHNAHSEKITRLNLEVKKSEAMLCAVLRALEKMDILNATINNINEIECGLTKRDISNWFFNHKQQDAKRGS